MESEDLALYDETFAARIGWKIDGVLAECTVRKWQPRCRRLIDWGCGTGVASRRVLEHWAGHFQEVTLVDRSPMAVGFAQERARSAFPGVEIRTAIPGVPLEGACVVLSHVLNELSGVDLAKLVEALGAAEEVIWVEAGTHQESRRLVEEVREPMLAAGKWVPVAPCTHSVRCGLRTPENLRHWCHSFGRAPSEIFQEGRWTEFARTQGIDLGTVPYAFLVLERAAVREAGPAGASRMLGVPREYKGFSKVLSCQAEGVEELMVQKRDAPGLLKELQKGDRVPVYRWQRAGAKILGEAPEAG